jgi:hypothetical protein
MLDAIVKLLMTHAMIVCAWRHASRPQGVYVASRLATSRLLIDQRVVADYYS